MSVRRVYVEKKPEYAIKARELKNELENYLGISTVTGVRVLIRYDIENISDRVYEEALATIFSEPIPTVSPERISRLIWDRWRFSGSPW